MTQNRLGINSNGQTGVEKRPFFQHKNWFQRFRFSTVPVLNGSIAKRFGPVPVHNGSVSTVPVRFAAFLVFPAKKTVTMVTTRDNGS